MTNIRAKSIYVAVPSAPLLVDIAASGPPVAGSEFSMYCIISENVTGLTNMPTAMWLDYYGTPLTTGYDISIITSRNETVAVATLTFYPLRASHGEGGELYWCAGNLMSPALDSVIAVTREEFLTVQGV